MTTVKQASKNLIKPAPEIATDNDAANKSKLALMPCVNAGVVVHTYQNNVVGKDADLVVMLDELRETFTQVRDGDLGKLEAMLIGQATALQTIFTSLAIRANLQERIPQYQTFLGLALKAQA